MVNAFLLARSLKEKMDSLNIEDLPKKMWQSKNEEECQSLVNEVKFAQEVIEKAESRNVSLVFPDDYKITDNYSDTEFTIKDEPDFSSDFQLDLGPKTIANYRKNILLDGEIKNIFWNGPLGAYDHPGSGEYAEGSVELVKTLFAAAISDKNISVVVGGGDSAATMKRIDVEVFKDLIRDQMKKQFNPLINNDLLTIKFNNNDIYTLCNYFTSNFFVSTGGGASLEFLDGFLKGKEVSDLASLLPGTSALMELAPV